MLVTTTRGFYNGVTSIIYGTQARQRVAKHREPLSLSQLPQPTINMSAMSFRQVDIDKLDPDSVVNQVPEITPSGVQLSDVQALESSVRQQLSAGRPEEALKQVLANPPYGSDEATKDTALKSVLTVLTAVRAPEVPALVKALDSEEQVVLTKYLYKAMGVPSGQANGGVLLTWLEKVVEFGGQGVVTKHLTDRRTV